MSGSRAATWAMEVRRVVGAPGQTAVSVYGEARGRRLALRLTARAARELADVLTRAADAAEAGQMVTWPGEGDR